MFLRPPIKRFKSARLVFRPVVIGSLCLFSATIAGCGKPFNVKTKTDLPSANYAADAAARSAIDGVSLQAQVIRDEDLLYDTFDANLFAAGVLPVRVMVNNSSARAVDLQKTRFVIHQPDGRGFKAVDARAAFKRLISYYEISAYNKSGFKDSLEAFAEYGVDLKTSLEPGQSRHGLLFFLVPGDAARGAGLTLVVSGLGGKSNTPVELKLN